MSCFLQGGTRRAPSFLTPHVEPIPGEVKKSSRFSSLTCPGDDILGSSSMLPGAMILAEQQ